ncbi:hypothetical protein WJX75_009288 [Coccomyxa subellipsoidea]|uniref:Uncharacterized protein n=1 Tax=Coccomyxa subellipsoidea TaxID=248742 RepID=A0ABR2YII2_9CHLO
MLINRTLEIVCFLLGHALPLFSLMQMPLSLMALGVFIKVSECSSVHPLAPPPAAAAMATTVAVAAPRPFCSAPIILAAILMLIEIVIFLLVLFITQTHREHQIMMLTHRIMEADIEAGRGFRDHAHVQPLNPAIQESNIKYCTVVQPCGQAIMVAVPEQETGAETGSASAQPVVCKEACAGSAVINSAAESTVGDSGKAEAVVEDLESEAAGQEDSSAVVTEASAEIQHLTQPCDRGILPLLHLQVAVCDRRLVLTSCSATASLAGAFIWGTVKLSSDTTIGELLYIVLT